MTTIVSLENFDRVVIGAGMSGLLAAWRAVDSGESVLVLEASPQAGGLLQPIEIAGIQIDCGAEAFSVAGPDFERLIADLQLESDLVYPRVAQASVITESGDRHLIPQGFLGIPASLDDPELELIFTKDELQLARQRDSLAVSFSADLTIADLVEQRLGSAFVDKLVDSLVRGVYSSSASKLNAQATIAPLVAAYLETGSLVSAANKIRNASKRPGSAVASLAGGMHRLPTQLVAHLEELGVTFIFGSRAERIQATSLGYLVLANGIEVTAEELTIAAGVTESCRLVLDEASESGDAGMVAHAADANLAIALVRSHELSAQTLGTGALVSAANPQVLARAVTHVNAKWQWVQDRLQPNEHIVRLSYDSETLESGPPSAEQVRQDLSYLYGADDVHVAELKFQSWPRSMFQPGATAGRYADQVRNRAEASGIELCNAVTSGTGLLAISRSHYERKSLERV